MHLCKYLITSGPTKTRNVCLKDITFLNYRGGTIDQHSREIFDRVAASITFREQKNREKWDKLMQEAIADLLLNPMHVTACIVSELWKLPGMTLDTPTYAFYNQDSTRIVSASEALEYLCHVAEVLGENRLDFKPY